MKSNNSTLTGIMLLVLLWITYIYITSPTKEELEQRRKEIEQARQEQIIADSLAQLKVDTKQQILDSLQNNVSIDSSSRDSIIDAYLFNESKSKLGIFAASGQGEQSYTTIENDKLKITLSNKGAAIQKVEVKDYLMYDHSTEDPYDKIPLVLMDSEQNRFDYNIPLSNTTKGDIVTSDLFFNATKEDNTVKFIANGESPDQFIEITYQLLSDYTLDYSIKLVGINDLMPRDERVTLNWSTYVPKVEKNPYYERTMTTVYYQEKEDFNYCNCRADDEAKLETAVDWISHSQQFFNTSFLSKENGSIVSAEVATVQKDEKATYLKELHTVAELNLDETNQQLDFSLYIGPNDYDQLVQFSNGLERIIPFGWSIFGFISRSVIRPMFNFFAMFISNYGIIILLLTLLIRFLLFPLQYKMLKSGVKMSVLKPELEKLRKKHKDDPQALQMAQMKIYQEYGVNPLGGCLPMLLTMPIWIALYRFFPASLDFRQKSFLWADDLVSYDSIWDFGEVPVISSIYGEHVSLFTLLWMISMFLFLWYNSKHMDMNAAANPQMKTMKYVQYSFPILFFFALNSWAAGLTAYMLFSNIFNIAQTYITKNILIDKDKLKEEMEQKKIDNKSKPKTGFMGKYQEMLQEQQKQMAKQKKKK